MARGKSPAKTIWNEPPLNALSSVTEAEVRYRHQLARESYHLGYRDGYEAGRRDLLDEQAEDARLDTNYLEKLAARPTFAELERRRWTLRGEQRTRETFALPHPADFPGRGEAA